jgi:hypothetical protein
MLESGLSGSVRGVLSNGHLYRDPGSNSDLTVSKCDFRFTSGSRLNSDIAGGRFRANNGSAIPSTSYLTPAFRRPSKYAAI